MADSPQFAPIPTLLPPPKSAVWKDGFLDWSIARFDADSRGLAEGAHVRNQTDDSIAHEQGYELKIDDGGILIKSRTETGARLAFQTLRQIALQSDERGMRMVEISDYPDLDVRGFMLDISRCKVPTMEELARLLDKLALFKYNRLELYTEHTYAFEGHEIVWANASPMTKSKYARLQKLCDFAGIELVANMNGLGHMERWLRYPQYAHLAESKAPFIDPLGTVRKFPTTLYPDKNALDFMDGLYAQFLPNFSSDKINIGGDEPWELGMGRSKERCQKEGKYRVYIDHILGLRNLCAARGKKELYFWADVLMQDAGLLSRPPVRATVLQDARTRKKLFSSPWDQYLEFVRFALGLRAGQYKSSVRLRKEIRGKGNDSNTMGRRREPPAMVRNDAAYSLGCSASLERRHS